MARKRRANGRVSQAAARAHQDLLAQVREARNLPELVRLIEESRARFSRNETLALFIEDAALERAQALGWECPRHAHEGAASHTARCAEALRTAVHPEQMRLLNGRWLPARWSGSSTQDWTGGLMSISVEQTEAIGREGARWRIDLHTDDAQEPRLLGSLGILEYQGDAIVEYDWVSPDVSAPHVGALRRTLRFQLRRFANEHHLHVVPAKTLKRRLMAP